MFPCQPNSGIRKSPSHSIRPGDFMAVLCDMETEPVSRCVWFYKAFGMAPGSQTQ